MLAFFCFGARYRPWRYFAALHSRVFGDGAAPRRTRCSPQPCQHSVFRASGGGVLQVLPSAPFFLRGGRQLFGAGRIQAFVHGKIFANALLGDWRWQYSRAMRSRVSIRGNIPPRCVPGRPSVAIFSPHASQKRPRTGKSPVRGKIRAPCIRKRAPFGKICAPCIRKAPQTAFRERTARRSCQEGPLFAARAPRIMHGAQILPSAVASNRPSARNTGAAEQREPPKLDRTTQETLPRRQRPRRLLGSKYRQQLPRYRHRPLPTPASSLSPSEQLCHCRQRHLWRQRSRRHRPADLPSCARPKGGLPSLLAAPVFCALGGCDRLINARRSPFYAIISLWLRKNRHPSGKTQALPIQWVGCSRGHVPYRTINKEKRLRWQLLHIALSARKRRKW